MQDQWEPEETEVAAMLMRNNISTHAKAILKDYYKNMIAFL